jgi:hypothetical protein
VTAQVHEKLIYEGEMMSIAFCPHLPARHPRILEVDPEEARGEDLPSILFSTACWRQYIGTWEIRDGRFYLVDITGRYKMVGDDPIPADWFSGVIRIPRGEILHYVHMGFGSVYEQEIHVKVKDGQVVRSRVIDNRGKEFDSEELAWRNLPGSENRFEGDDM